MAYETHPAFMTTLIITNLFESYLINTQPLNIHLYIILPTMPTMLQFFFFVVRQPYEGQDLPADYSPHIHMLDDRSEQSSKVSG